MRARKGKPATGSKLELPLPRRTRAERAPASSWTLSHGGRELHGKRQGAGAVCHASATLEKKATPPYRRSYGNNGGYIRYPSPSDEVNATPPFPKSQPGAEQWWCREVITRPVSAWEKAPKTTSLTPRAGSQWGFARAKRKAGYHLVANGTQYPVDGAVSFLVSGTGTVVCQVATHQH